MRPSREGRKEFRKERPTSTQEAAIIEEEARCHAIKMGLTNPIDEFMLMHIALSCISGPIEVSSFFFF